MYQDLLEFQNSLLKLVTGRGWKATFSINWRDYQEPFSNLIKNFDHHERTLKKLLETYLYQTSNDMSRRLNNYLQQYQTDRVDLEIHINQYEEDRKGF